MKKNQITKSLLAVALTTAFLLSGYSQVAVPNVHAAEQIDDRDLDLLLEIAKSDLEEKTFVKDGIVVNGYSNSKEAGVSQEAFEEFEKMISFANNEIKKGNMIVGKNILDTKADIINTNSSKACSSKQSTKNIQPMAFYLEYYVSASKATKIGKALAAGIGGAALASYLKLPAAVAAVLTALYGANELCNWDGNGYTLYYVITPIPAGYCIPD
ncbi:MULTISPECIES: hypothetical protein [Brevibacillus]|uniref:hypothetical protein n=1 Tax=Brevibacillus TaxID=55080 RepID=UPI000EE8EEF1|nr:MULTISPECIES: hypothetical protein [Brevibacillus]MBU8711108.1 hypothetical protein [Brevibacillus parabrevis]MED2253776.1 hypothetical protein [Brevibacillus parabrevis]NRQ53889.1 hypothetical protein [Brevibacillus sp. HD1.4A]HBZ79884.1 hypothetical protein [Brevibacillus sp.]